MFLCGLETPVLKLQKSETGVSEYVSVVEASSTSSPSSPPEQVTHSFWQLPESKLDVPVARDSLNLMQISLGSW